MFYTLKILRKNIRIAYESKGNTKIFGKRFLFSVHQMYRRRKIPIYLITIYIMLICYAIYDSISSFKNRTEENYSVNSYLKRYDPDINTW